MTTITITASPTDEQIVALSTLKGYPTEVTIFEDILTPYPESTAPDGTIVPASEALISTPKQVPNPQTREDYIRQVYEGIISNDIQNEFIRYTKSLREEQDRLEDEAIRASIQGVITSNVK